MANINPIDLEYFKSFALEIISKFQRIKKIIPNREASGNYHEEIIRTVLRNFLTKRYSVKTGFIYKDSSNISKQLDILIIDENEPAAYIFQEGDFAVVIPEAVVAVIEVKTTVNKNIFKDAVFNLSSVKSLYEFPMHIPTIVISFSGSNPNESNLNKWFSNPIFQIKKLKTRNIPDAFLFLNYGCLILKVNETNIFSSTGNIYKKLYRQNDGNDVGWQLSIVLALIINACSNKNSMALRSFPSTENIQRLVQSENAMISNEYYCFDICDDNN